METKQCGTCKETLSTDRFYWLKPSQPTHSGRYSTECKDCKSRRSIKHHGENREQHARTISLRYQTFGRFAKYGLTIESYEALLESQGRKCALCGAAAPGGKHKWHIDHAGGTNPRVYNQCKAGGVRGLLCHRCNVSLGHYEKLLERVGLKRISEYLKVK